MGDMKLRCRCGGIEGRARDISPRAGDRIVCHCGDCQAFARWLGQADEVLDGFGGTDIFQLPQSRITIDKGAEQLRAVRLRPGGLIRWYAACCRTPIANTVSAAIPVAGLVLACAEREAAGDADVGPVRYFIQGQDALAPRTGVTLHPRFPPALIARLLWKVSIGRLLGRHRPSPFFDDAGKPVSEPEVASEAPA